MNGKRKLLVREVADFRHDVMTHYSIVGVLEAAPQASRKVGGFRRRSNRVGVMLVRLGVSGCSGKCCCC